MFWMRNVLGGGAYRVKRLYGDFIVERLTQIWIVTKQKAEQDHVAGV